MLTRRTLFGMLAAVCASLGWKPKATKRLWLSGLTANQEKLYMSQVGDPNPWKMTPEDEIEGFDGEFQQILMHENGVMKWVTPARGETC